MSRVKSCLYLRRCDERVALVLHVRVKHLLPDVDELLADLAQSIVVLGLGAAADQGVVKID